MAAILHLLDQRRLIDSNGISAGGSIAFYLTGTTTPASIYSDVDLTTPLTNPIVVGAGAEVPTIYLDGAVTYRRVITYSDGSTDETDPYVQSDYLAAAAASASAAASSATAAAASETAAETAQAGAESARDEALQYGAMDVYATWTALAAATGMAAGDFAAVIASDTGTHTDPVVGGTVDNAGYFRYDDSPAGWERVGDLESQLASGFADDALGHSTEAAASLAALNSQRFPIFADDPLYGQAIAVDQNGGVVFGLSLTGEVYNQANSTFPIFSDDPLYGSSVVVNEAGEVVVGASVSRPAADKIIVLLGDSITANYNIAGLVASLTSATVHNFAWGGSRMSSGGSAFANAYSVAAIAGAVASGTWTSLTAGIATDYPSSSSTDIAARARGAEMAAFDWTTPDAILILGGTNDWSAQVTLGSATSTTTTEFNGAINEIIRQLQEEAPAAQIGLATPTWRGPLATLGDSNANPNGAGVYLSAFCDAIRNNRWQVPVLDLAKTLGINTANKTLMLADDLHPTTTGAARWAQRIATFINSLF